MLLRIFVLDHSWALYSLTVLIVLAAVLIHCMATSCVVVVVVAILVATCTAVAFLTANPEP